MNNILYIESKEGMIMVEDRYLRFYYENYFLNDRCNWGYLYAVSCMANGEKPEVEAAEDACEILASKEKLFAAWIKKARNLFTKKPAKSQKIGLGH